MPGTENDLVSTSIASAVRIDVPAPYLDVISIMSPNLIPVEKYQEHNHLLMEPIAMPSLEHTGIRTGLEKVEKDLSKSSSNTKEEKPLFYPDGRKKKNFRVAIREAIRELEEKQALGDGIDELETTLSRSVLPEPKAGYRKPKGKKPPPRHPIKPEKLVVVKHASREADLQLKELLAGIRKERYKIEQLVLK